MVIINVQVRLWLIPEKNRMWLRNWDINMTVLVALMMTLSSIQGKPEKYEVFHSDNGLQDSRGNGWHLSYYVLLLQKTEWERCSCN